MLQCGLLSFRPTEIILIHEKNVWQHEAKLSTSNFSLVCQINLRWSKTQSTPLQLWSLFSEHICKLKLNVGAGLPLNVFTIQPKLWNSYEIRHSDIKLSTFQN